ncbi:MAG: 2-C-methyl-D-erythritol 4-phosphate cytidylyltransferase [Bacteroidales bacterium]|nr:2-C-methyl-D-erythritol 4-phosphate cytidylyltransferase [Bacteroidales bacterium]
MQKIIIIVAGGKGMRMGNDLPKQFLPIGGKPVLMHTLEKFHSADAEMKLILVLPEAQQDYWRELCTKYNFSLPHTIANGGETRFHSVKNGLEKATKEISDKAIIGVHDGVRPFVSTDVIRNCYKLTQKNKAVIPVIEVHETIRKIENSNSKTVDRSSYRLVQTPQVFQSDILINAYQQNYASGFTDDASVVEAAGITVTLTEGNRENIKITTPFDIIVAEAILAVK